jgi:pimeloyl-ACP methyl ester carboxylesterase
VNGIELYYEQHGTGPAVVLAHGGGGNHFVWWQQVPELARTRTVVTFDQRAFGRSINREGELRHTWYPHDLRALLDHLGIERAAVVGQSLGGYTAGRFASLHPDRVSALVLCSTWAGISTSTVERWKKETLADPVAAARRHSPNFASRTPELHFLYEQLAMLNPPRHETLVEQLTALSEPSTDVEAIVGAGIPVLLVAGSEDSQSATTASLRPLIPASRFVELQCGHNVYFERAAEFNQLVTEFLDAATGPEQPRQGR